MVVAQAAAEVTVKNRTEQKEKEKRAMTRRDGRRCRNHGKSHGVRTLHIGLSIDLPVPDANVGRRQALGARDA